MPLLAAAVLSLQIIEAQAPTVIAQQVTAEAVEWRPAPWVPLASASLTREDLALVGWDAATAVQLLKARAGTTFREDRVYVDGMPASGLPAAAAIGRVSINPDPFSVLFSESDQNVIEVISATPDRAFRWSASLLPPEIGARNLLAPDLRTARSARSASGSGGLPGTPLTFSADVNFAATRDERPVFSSASGTPSSVESSSSGHSMTVGVVGRWHSTVTARLTFASTRGRGTAIDSGGFVGAASSTDNAMASDDGRLVVNVDRPRYEYRSGLAYTSMRSAFAAEADGPSVVILDVMTAGGAPAQATGVAARGWLWNNVLTARDASWLAGWSLSSSGNRETIDPNPDGQLMFGSTAEYAAAAAGLGGGTLTRVPGRVDRQLTTTAGALFAQRQWQLSPRALVRAGARADYQTDDGIALSPRVSARVHTRFVTMQSGAGVFRQNWSNDVLMQALRFGNDGAERVIDDVPARSASAPGFTRPVSLVVRNGIQIRRNRIGAGFEHAWTVGIDRAGSRRLRTVDGWLDQLESGRRLRRHQLHGRVEYSVGRATITAHYERVISFDDSDGAFAFPERQDDVAREWARSTGVSPNNVSIVGDLPPVAGINAGVVFTARSRAPLDIRTGLDVDGTGLYVDRGGWPRNSGSGPEYRSLDAFARRRIGWLDVTLAVDNLLDAPNVDRVGSTLASPFFERPIAVQPGRSVRMSVRLVR